MPEPRVILVDVEDRQLGDMEKMEAHYKGILHRAFSVFIFNEAGEMLLQKRALSKYHSPGLWTNACCSHPSPGELTSVAASRRLMEELGFNCDLQEIGAFTYKTVFDNGLTEHEFDHVFYGLYTGLLNIDPNEVEEVKWLGVTDLELELQDFPDTYTSWFKLAYPLVKNWIGSA